MEKSQNKTCRIVNEKYACINSTKEPVQQIIKLSRWVNTIENQNVSWRAGMSDGLPKEMYVPYGFSIQRETNK